MIVFQEAAYELPKLSQSSLYVKFDQQSQLTQKMREAISNPEAYVKPESMKEIMALIRLNGSKFAKLAADKFENGQLKIIYEADTPKMNTSVLPFLVRGMKDGTVTPYVFATKLVSNIQSTSEYYNLMADMEAAYLAAALVKNPAQMLLNRQVVLNLCELYIYLWLMPLEQKLYMKGENLTKAQIYIISYFYRMIDGDRATADSIPFNRFLRDRVPDSVLKQLVSQVHEMESMAIEHLIALIIQLNPIRYKDLQSTFMSYFQASCGVPLIFALENPQYLFLLLTSSYYKTKITAYALNKTALETSRKCMKNLSGIDIKF
jgi:hypothetical protein